MNAIRPLNAFVQAVRPLPDPLAARRAFVERRLAELQAPWLRSDGVELRILPHATPEERIAMAAILLDGTGMRLTKED